LFIYLYYTIYLIFIIIGIGVEIWRKIYFTHNNR